MREYRKLYKIIVIPKIINHKITQIFTEYNNRDEELRIEIEVCMIVKTAKNSKMRPSK